MGGIILTPKSKPHTATPLQSKVTTGLKLPSDSDL